MLNGPHVPVLFRVLRKRAVSLLAWLAVYGDQSWESLLGSWTRNSFPIPLLEHSIRSGTPVFLCLLGSWDHNDAPKILLFSSPVPFSERDISHWRKFLRVLILRSGVIALSGSQLMEAPSALPLSSNISWRFTILHFLPCKKQLFCLFVCLFVEFQIYFLNLRLNLCVFRMVS